MLACIKGVQDPWAKPSSIGPMPKPQAEASQLSNIIILVSFLLLFFPWYLLHSSLSIFLEI